jgi:NADH-ubiquinone oxidoreductase chain 2
MLSIIILTAIIAVALPQLRITTLSIVRSISIAYALAVIYVLISSIYNNICLFNNIIIIDIISIYLIISIFILIIFIISFYTSNLIENSSTPYTLVIFIIIFIIGSYYLITAIDIISIVIALEIQSFSLYALTTVYRWREGATSAGLIYFILGAFSSGLILLGFSIIYTYIGETNIINIISYITLINEGSSGQNINIIKISLVIIFSGLFFKCSAAPYHY